MKILSPAQIAAADQYTIQNEPISPADLMERAATKCFEWLITHFENTQDVCIICGSGNNGGDGLVIARLLKSKGFAVNTYLLPLGNQPSEAFKLNLERLNAAKGKIHTLSGTSDFPKISKETLVIDALFGNGLNRSPQGLSAQLIQYLNTAKAVVVAIDMPSGLFASQPITDGTAVIKATYTLSFQTPKLALFLPDNKKFVNNWEVLDIGLDLQYINQLDCPYFYFTNETAKHFYRHRTDKWAHKGTFGHSLIVAGSYGKIGAAILAAKAALKIGSGLITTYIPECGYQIMQTAVPEAMVETDSSKLLCQFSPLVKATAIAIGPGMGTAPSTQHGFASFIKNAKQPLVLDADALNCLALNKELLTSIPPQSILTPHPKELERLIGKWHNDYEKLEKAQQFTQKYKVVLLVKGKYSMTLTADTIYFNSTGNNALATAGSGDVLTGIITGLLAQGYSSIQATLLGVYLHGSCADIFAKENAPETFTASQIIHYLSAAINML